jgi:Spy/CpxP family protein refolding chaperone
MLLTVVALVVGVSVPAVFAIAAEPTAAQKGGGALAERMQDLNLTDQQEARIADIRKDFQPKVKAAAKALHAIVQEEMEKARAVLTPEQRTTLASIKEERQEHKATSLAERIVHLEELDLTDAELAKIGECRKQCRPKIVNALEGLKGILTDEQRQVREEGLKAGKKRKEILASLKLTDAQKAKVEAVCKELTTLVREECESIRDVLTESQKEKLQDFKDERKEHVRDRMAHMVANLKSLNLNDSQKSQIMEIRKAYRPKVHEAGNALRAVIREEVDSIVAVIKKG